MPHDSTGSSSSSSSLWWSEPSSEDPVALFFRLALPADRSAPPPEAPLNAVWRGVLRAACRAEDGQTSTDNDLRSFLNLYSKAELAWALKALEGASVRDALRASELCHWKAITHKAIVLIEDKSARKGVSPLDMDRFAKRVKDAVLVRLARAKPEHRKSAAGLLDAAHRGAMGRIEREESASLMARLVALRRKK